MIEEDEVMVFAPKDENNVFDKVKVLEQTIR